jgi:hypothetical protein
MNNSSSPGISQNDMATRPPFTPWTHQNKSKSSLTQQTMEKIVPPGNPIPQTNPDYTHKELPPIPHSPKKQSKQNRNCSSSYVMTEDIQVDGLGIAEGSRPALRPKSNSSPSTFPHVLPPPPKPPMSKSTQKVLQLTGHDMRYDRAITEERSEFLDSSGSSQSSASVYSQNEEEAKVKPANPKRHASSSSAPTAGETGSYYPKFSNYSVVNKSTSPGLPLAKAKALEASLRSEELQVIPEFRRGIAPTYSTEPVTIRDFIEETQKHFTGGLEHDAGALYSHGMTDPSLSHLVPAPLAIGPKRKKDDLSSKGDKTSLFANVRDSMAWGIKELTEAHIIRSKEPVIPENHPMGPPPISTRKRNLSSGKNPLKSPFPLYTSAKNSDTGESESKLSKRFSGAIKRLSGGKSLPTKTTIISNSARAADGPDTPMPVKSGFMAAFPSVNVSESVHNGNEHLQEVYERAKKTLKIKTSDERRRESLKKKIVVVGVTDQSPGMSFFHLSN